MPVPTAPDLDGLMSPPHRDRWLDGLPAPWRNGPHDAGLPSHRCTGPGCPTSIAQIPPFAHSKAASRPSQRPAAPRLEPVHAQPVQVLDLTQHPQGAIVGHRQPLPERTHPPVAGVPVREPVLLPI